MTLFLDRQEVPNWDSMLRAMPDKEFQNVTRSTLPLLGHRMGMPLDPATEHRFEYTVASVGRARPSHTDLMVIGSGVVEAIEAKSTEPRYETVSEWLAKPGGLKAAAFGHWLNLISGITAFTPDPSLISRCVYQMVHRLASVCSIDRPSRVLTYQVFEVGLSHDFYRADLEYLLEVFALSGFVELRLSIVQTTLTPQGLQLSATLPSVDTRERARLIRQALLAGRLFKFGAEKTEVISRRSP